MTSQRQGATRRRVLESGDRPVQLLEPLTSDRPLPEGGDDLLSGGRGVTVAVCTRRRPALLARALASLAQMHWPEGWSLIVVDNDEYGGSHKIVDEARNGFPVHIDYLVEQTRGYATVRNAAIAFNEHRAATCFFDDDMVAGVDWLLSMKAEHELDRGAIIHAPVFRVHKVPTDPLAVEALTYDAFGSQSLTFGGTGGMLLPRTVLDKTGRFNPRYDHTGGEDTDLMVRARLDGIRTRVAETAIVFEEDREVSLPVRTDAAKAFRSGRLFIDVMRQNGYDTGVARLRAAIGVFPSSIRWAAKASTKRPRAELRAEMRLTFRRLGVLTAARGSSHAG